MDFPILCNSTTREENDPERLSLSRRCANKVPRQTSIKTLPFLRTLTKYKRPHKDTAAEIQVKIEKSQFTLL